MWLGRLSTVLAITMLSAGSVSARESLLDASALSGVVVAGPVIADGDLSWTEGGYGKLEHRDGAFDLDGVVAWRPSITPVLGAHLSVAGQIGLDEGIGLDEAYIRLRRDPQATMGLSGRAGLFFPPASREHDGADWTTQYTITPSAIGSWVAEEVKVAGLEATIHVPLGAQNGSLTLAVFGANDTAGTLLTFRGWALHDIRATASQTLALPPTPNLFAGLQAPRTRPVGEIDDQLGVYARGEASLSRSLKIGALAYANGGDRVSVGKGQYAWKTRFLTIDAHWRPRDDMVVIAQALAGDTEMGVAPDGRIMAHAAYYSAYLLASRYFGAGSLTARIEAFGVDDKSFVIEDNNDERGAAFTASWAIPLSTSAELVAESVSVWSDRPSRGQLGEDPRRLNASARPAIRTRF
ncbi:MAG: hypothetical protein KKA45_07000 [Alphaproteobacteria bacterium]|nr:hypothetical protein [Alphaproteobacteria bacterium]